MAITTWARLRCVHSCMERCEVPCSLAWAGHLTALPTPKGQRLSEDGAIFSLAAHNLQGSRLQMWVPQLSLSSPCRSNRLWRCPANVDLSTVVAGGGRRIPLYC